MIYITGGLKSFTEKLRNIRSIRIYFLSASLLAVNWFTFIWSVNNGFIVEASLGYFINPLVNVFLGVVILKERLRPGQWLALIIAAGGVLYLTFNYGSFPWIALTLAFSFAAYGLIRKTGRLEALDGLSFETGLLFLPALLFLIFGIFNGQTTIVDQPLNLQILVTVTGIITALPLLLFAYGARRITLTSLGFMQYIAPTLQFLLGVLLYNEPFSQQRFIGFMFIWGALIIFSLETFYYLQRTGKAAA